MNCRRSVFVVLANLRLPGRLLVLFLATTPALAQSTGKNVFLTVALTNERGQVVPGLEKERFSVSEKNAHYEITSFSNDNQPASVAMILDMSGSVTSTRLPIMASWITRFIAGANRANEYLLIGFDVQPSVLCNWRCSEKELSTALSSFSNAKTKNDTALFDACAFGFDQLKSRTLSKRAMVVLSDGMDNESKISLGRLRQLFQQSEITFYGIDTMAFDGSAASMLGEDVLDKLAWISGGHAFFPRTRDEFEKIADHLSFELGHQYTLGFTLAPVPGRPFREIKLKLVPPAGNSSQKSEKLLLRYRPTVYVP